MKSKKLTSLLVLMMTVIIMLGTLSLSASAATAISKTTVTYTQNYTYTGKAIKPAVTVKNGKKKLKADKDYTVAYKNNKNVGKATITVTGKGSYNGKVTKSFYIKPKAVSSLKATVYANKIKLSWGKVTGAKGYQVYQKIDGSWKKVATPTGTSATISGLNGATKYEFRVRAYAKADNKTLYSAYKNISKTTTVGKVSGISAGNITESTATLKWNKVQGATSYRVTLTNKSTGYKRTLTSTAISLNLTNLDALSEYSVKINALNTSKNLTGADSALYTFKTAPSAVTGLKVEVAPDTSVKITWNSVFGADGYKVSYDKLDASGKVVSTNSSDVMTKTSCTVKNLTPGMYYVFKVVAGVKTSSGYVYSKAVSWEKTLIPVTEVPSFKAAASGSDSIVLTWSRPGNIDGYKIYKDGNLVTTLEAKITTYTLTDLTPGKSYKVAICAYLKDLNGISTDGKKTEATVTLSSNSIQSITFASRPSSLKVGETYQLSVKITPDNAADKSVTYSSSDTSVATVSAGGLITAVKAGTATIKATCTADTSKSVSFNLTVNASGNSDTPTVPPAGGTVKVESVSLKSEITLYEGDIISLNPTFTPANATNKSYTVTGANSGSYEFSKYISITSSNFLKANKATLDSSGNPFYFTVTVKTNDGNKTATTRVKVEPRMIFVEYNGIESSPWYYGNSAKLSVTLHDTIESKYSLSDIRFRSDNTSVATVTNDGTVTCKGVGEVVITAYTSDNKYSGDFTLYSRKAVSVPKTLYHSCKVGQTYTISGAVLPEGSSDVLVYYSGDSSIASVETKNNQGIVTFKKAGSVMISVHNASDPFNPKQVWMTTETPSIPSGSNAQLLSVAKTKANALKGLSNLPSITRYDETKTSGFSISSNKISASDLQQIFNSELAPRTTYYSSIVSSDSNYTSLKKQFISKVPVANESYVISPNLSESDIKSISVTNDEKDYYYEIKMTLKDESMSSLPASPSSTRHGKVFDILTSGIIDDKLETVNATGTMSITYASFAQKYHDSTLTLRVNKATGNIERASYDMNLDINISSLKMKYTLILLPTTVTMDVSFKCNNIVVIDFKDYK